MKVALTHALAALAVALSVWTARLSPATAQVPGDLVGMWDQWLPEGHVREVIEFRSGGTYTSGLCPAVLASPCVRRQATASIQGEYVVRGNTVAVDKGIVNLRHGGHGGEEVQEVYCWRVEQGRPDTPQRKLHLTAANGEQVMLFETPSEDRPSWVKRADR